MKLAWRFPVITVLLASAVLAGCGTTNTATATAPAVPSAQAATATAAPTVAIPLAPLTVPQTVSRTIQLDPAIAQDNDTLAVSGLVYDTLVGLDASGNPQPALALTWTVSDDQLDYILTLRQGVSFSSGSAFNADAVLTNFNRWFDPANALHGSATYPGWSKYFLGFKGDKDAQGAAVSFFDGIEKVDEHTVLIHLNRPEPQLLQILAQPYFAILDPAMMTSAGAKLGTSAKTVSGTGAYRLTDWVDAGLDLAPNAAYWGKLPSASLHLGWK